MILFGHFDDKFLCIKKELKNHFIDSDAIKAIHPILTPFYLIKLIIQGKKIKVYVFRYLNDNNSLVLAILRVCSELLTIFLLKIFKIKIWWLCHNIDKETSMFFPWFIKIRRRNVVKYSDLIFTTNSALVPKAKELFPNRIIDSLSLGYIDNGFSKIKTDFKIENKLKNWCINHKNSKSKIVFCIGSAANKSLHFKLITKFIENINVNSRYVWYAVVIGDKVQSSKYIYNIPYKFSIDKSLIKKYADFYYRVIDDYSMSYSIYEAAELQIPVITENFGILPKIIKDFNIGIVIDSNNINSSKILDDFVIDNLNFSRFNELNNWAVTGDKLSAYYISVK